MRAEDYRDLLLRAGKIGQRDNEQPGKVKRQPRRDLEGPIHKAIKDLLDLLGLLYHHSPNELDMSGKEAQICVSKAKRRGMRPGWPDFEIIHNGRFYGLEVKAETGQSDVQRQVQADIERCGGFYAIVRSADEAQMQLKEWGLI